HTRSYGDWSSDVCSSDLACGNGRGSQVSSPQKKIGALIVDDEELARHVVRELLATHREIEILAECANGFEAVKAFGEHKPDLVRSEERRVGKGGRTREGA